MRNILHGKIRYSEAQLFAWLDMFDIAVGDYRQYMVQEYERVKRETPSSELLTIWKQEYEDFKDMKSKWKTSKQQFKENNDKITEFTKEFSERNDIKDLSHDH